MTAQVTKKLGGRSGWALGLLALGVTIACSQFTVRTERDPDADFTRYRSFGWLPIAQAAPIDQDTGDRDLTKRVYSAVEARLAGKGYAPAASDAADLLVTFRVLRMADYEAPHFSYTMPWRMGAYRDALHASGDSYDRGSLIIDVIDRRANELVWRGSASARLLPSMSYAKSVERIDAAVQQILAPLPAR